MSPTGNPKFYRQEFLKTILFFLNVMPLVNLSLINLIPDPCDFDFHLREQMMSMAQARAPQFDPKDDPRLRKTIEEDTRRGIMLMWAGAMRRRIRQLNPNLEEEEVEGVVKASVRMREHDPLGVLQEGSLEGGKDGGQMNMCKLSPNFEITMYLAQATGACIVTDSPFRWREVQGAVRQRYKAATPGLAQLVTNVSAQNSRFRRT